MNCQSCGRAMPDEARFCMVCGADLTLGKACAYCGTNLPLTARFCFMCGKSTEQAAEPVQNIYSPAAADTAPPVAETPPPAYTEPTPPVEEYPAVPAVEEYRSEPVPEPAQEYSFSDLYSSSYDYIPSEDYAVEEAINLAELDLDPCPFHYEYGPSSSTEWAVNKDWCVRSRYGDVVLRSLDGKRKCTVCHNSGIGGYLIGFNGSGIWFKDYDPVTPSITGNEWWNKVFVLDVSGFIVRSIDINASAYDLKELYVCGDRVLYVQYDTNNYILKLIDNFGNKITVIKSPTPITNISMTEKFISFHIEGRGFIICKTDNQKVVFAESRTEQDYNNSEVKIKYLFLSQVKIWTLPTRAECEQHDLNFHDLVEKTLGEPTKMPITSVWKDFRSIDPVKYFDGKEVYSSPYHTTLRRYSRDGSTASIASASGRGSADFIYVSDNYLLTDCDEQAMRSYPRKFSDFTGSAEDNAESIYIER